MKSGPRALKPSIGRSRPGPKLSQNPFRKASAMRAGSCRSRMFVASCRTFAFESVRSGRMYSLKRSPSSRPATAAPRSGDKRRDRGVLDPLGVAVAAFQSAGMFVSSGDLASTPTARNRMPSSSCSSAARASAGRLLRRGRLDDRRRRCAGPESDGDESAEQDRVDRGLGRVSFQPVEGDEVHARIRVREKRRDVGRKGGSRHGLEGCGGMALRRLVSVRGEKRSGRRLWPGHHPGQQRRKQTYPPARQWRRRLADASHRSSRR